MRESIVHILDAELTRQLGSRELGNLTVDGALDLGALADAILADLPAAIPAAQLVERLSAIAEKMEGAMTVEVENADNVIAFSPDLFGENS